MIDLREEPVVDLREHAGIPSIFEAQSIFDVLQTPTGFGLVERTIGAPYRKNYDQFEDPLAWPRNFDTERWVLTSAFVGLERVGGLVTAVATPGVDMLEGRTDLAGVWDLRDAPAHRRVTRWLLLSYAEHKIGRSAWAIAN